MDLLQLLGVLAGSQAREAPAFGNPTPPEAQEPFTLPNPPPAPPAPTFGGGPQGNPPGVLSAAPRAPQGDNVEAEVPVVANRPYDFRGMVGLHGTPRNILGVLGDAFLRQGGGQALYEPRRRQEAEANAMRGFVDNPLVAMQRLSRENPAAAREMFEHYQQNEIRQNTYRDTHETHALGVLASMAGTATAQNWAALRPQILRYAEQAGVTPPSPLPVEFDEDAINNWRRLGIPAGTQERNDETNDWHSVLDTNSDEGRRDNRDYRNRSLGLRGQDLRLRRDIGERPMPISRIRGSGSVTTVSGIIPVSVGPIGPRLEPLLLVPLGLLAVS